MEKYFNYFIYVSLAFLLWTLHRRDLVHIPEIVSIRSLVLSMALLAASFVMLAFMWQRFLDVYGYHTGFRDCVAAVGLTVFGKYIPGKIWLLLGVAGVISQRYRFPMGQITIIALKLQMCVIWAGLVLGIVVLYLTDGLAVWTPAVAVAFVVLSLILFSARFNCSAETVIGKILPKSVHIPVVSLPTMLKLLPIVFGQWFLLSLGFYFLVRSMTSIALPAVSGLLFPISVTIGILVLFSPGGLGVREAVIVGYLTQIRIPADVATSIAVASRLWFTIGEIFIFVVGFAVNAGRHAGTHQHESSSR